MTVQKRNLVWVCAGSDSFAAAGLQADIKTLACFNIHAATVVTAVTAQSPTECKAVHALPKQQILDQFDALATGPAPKAIKVGMLASRDTFNVLRTICAQQNAPLILDPVLQSSSGASLIGDLNPKEILTLTKVAQTLLTPNVPEAELLSGLKIKSPDDLPKAAAALLEAGAAQIIIKGGHANTDRYVFDFYADRDGLQFFMRSPRHPIKNLRGTGCTFASAVTAGIAQGLSPDDAVVLAKAYLNQCFALARSADTALIAHEPPVRSHRYIPEILPFADISAPHSKSPVHHTGFYVIADSAAWVKKLASWNVPTIQLRIKNLEGDAIRREINAAIEAVRGTNSALYINDYWQEAIAANAFGVHLGQEDLIDADIEAIKTAGLRLGISTHSWYEAAVAQTMQPSYMALGPIYPTTCKSMRFGPKGFAKLNEWVSAWDTPVVAIGGLTLGHAPELKASQCSGVAVVSDVLWASDPRARIDDWLKALAD